MHQALEPPYERLIGRYALYGEIASGGMATVHFGRLLGPVGFSRTVAIKRLHAQFAKDPEFVAMFLDEARLAGRIQHPNVVATLDVVALDGELFLVMEYVQGESLAKLLGTMHKSRTKIPPHIAAAIVTGMLYGLHAAHEATDERGQPLCIVHRDVSPQNVLVGTDGTSRVLDFGVAKASGRMQNTREGEIKGKLAYMAPEQMKGGAMDRRTDIYGAAVVLWEALTVRRLFDGEHAGVVFTKVMAGVIEPASRIAPGVPPALDDIIARGLAREPERRYATAREMAMDIEDRVGIASPRQVSEWLLHVAGDALSQRAVRVKEIESVSTPPPITLDSVVAAAGQVKGGAAPQGARPEAISSPPDSASRVTIPQQPGASSGPPQGGGSFAPGAVPPSGAFAVASAPGAVPQSGAFAVASASGAVPPSGAFAVASASGAVPPSGAFAVPSAPGAVPQSGRFAASSASGASSAVLQSGAFGAPGGASLGDAFPAPGSFSADPALPPGSPSQVSSISVTSPSTLAPAQAGARSLWIVAGAAALTVFGAAAFFVFRGDSSSTAAQSADGSAVGTSSAASAALRNTESAAPTASAADIQASVADAGPDADPGEPIAIPAPPIASPAATPGRAAGATPIAQPGTRSTAAPSKSPRGGDCNPPFTIDSTGIRRPKPQCL